MSGEFCKIADGRYSGEILLGSRDIVHLFGRVTGKTRPRPHGVASREKVYLYSIHRFSVDVYHFESEIGYGFRG